MAWHFADDFLRILLKWPLGLGCIDAVIVSSLGELNCLGAC
jgi:hypothetical protein